MYAYIIYIYILFNYASQVNLKKLRRTLYFQISDAFSRRRTKCKSITCV